VSAARTAPLEEASLRETSPYRVFVINLERAAKRRAHMTRLLKQLDLDAEFIPAVDGAALAAADRAAYDPGKARVVYGAEMTDAEIACYLSHYRLYERMVRQDIGCALILEDDVEASPDLKEIVGRLLELPENSWSVIRLESLRASVVTPTDGPSIGQKIADVRGGGLYRLETHVLGGGGYLIRRAGAERMLAYGRRIFMPIDHTLDRFWENGILPFVVRPFPIRQRDDFPTLIGPRGREVSRRRTALSVSRRRLARASDGISKRLFRLCMRSPALGCVLAMARIRSAALAIDVVRQGTPAKF
jgi:glycosyl transferase family 25